MEFRKFPSLENTNKQRTLFAIVEQNIQGPWIVSEKVDGANFCFYTDGTEVRVASRTQFVDGTFFNCQEVIDRYKDKVLALWGAGKREGVLMVYGELYGPKINGRINYGEKDFIAFDLVFSYPDGSLDISPKLVALELCSWFGIPTVPIVVVPTLDEALQVPKSFRSYLTPEEHEGDNFAEGVVIEPEEPQFFANGNRVYLKNRSEEFEEIANVPRKVGKEPIILPGHVQSMLDEISPYITENRVYNVISKIGEVGKEDFGKLLSLTVSDALLDYAKDKDAVLSELVGDAEKILNKSLAKVATLPVRKVFMERLAA